MGTEPEGTENAQKNVEQEEIPGKPEDGGEDEDWVHPDDPNPHPPTPRPPQPSHIEPDEEKKTKTIKEYQDGKIIENRALAFHFILLLTLLCIGFIAYLPLLF